MPIYCMILWKNDLIYRRMGFCTLIPRITLFPLTQFLIALVEINWKSGVPLVLRQLKTIYPIVLKHIRLFWKGTFFQKDRHLLHHTTMADFGNFVQKVFKTNLNFRYRSPYLSALDFSNSPVWNIEFDELDFFPVWNQLDIFSSSKLIFFFKFLS